MKFLADIEAERRQAAPKGGQAPAETVQTAGRIPSLPPLLPTMASALNTPMLLPQTTRRIPPRSGAPNQPRYTTTYFDDTCDIARGPANAPAGAPYLGRKIAEVSLEPEAEKKRGDGASRRAEKDKKPGAIRAQKKRIPEPDEEDPYYGLQLKSLEEYRKDYEKTLSFQAITDEDLAAHADQAGEEEGAEFRYLFAKAEIRDPNEESEIARRFEEIRAARKRRVQQAIRETGSLQTDIFSLVQG